MSLTTVRYGDIYPVSDLGRMAMSSSLLGAMPIALPAGILTDDYMREMREETERANPK